MSLYAGYCWCATCEKYAPFTHDCLPTARAELIKRGRDLLPKIRPFVGRAITDVLGELLAQAEWVPLHRQGVWHDADGRFFADVGGKLQGPFQTANQALTEYLAGYSHRTKKQTAIYPLPKKPAGVGAGADVPYTPAATTDDATPFEPSEIGVLVATVPGGIRIYKREEKFIFEQAGSTIALDFEGMHGFANAIHKAVARPDPFAWGDKSLARADADAVSPRKKLPADAFAWWIVTRRGGSVGVEDTTTLETSEAAEAVRGPYATKESAEALLEKLPAEPPSDSWPPRPPAGRVPCDDENG